MPQVWKSNSQRLDQLNKTWQATLQSAKQPETPAPSLAARAECGRLH